MTKIIVELCQNHLGKREILGRMIKEAATAGADYVKGQIIFSEDLTFRERFEDGCITNDGVIKTIKRPYQAEYDRLKGLDLTEDDYKWFVDESMKNNVVPLVTIFSRNRIEFASKLPWPEKIVKVASYDCASYAMIRELCDVFDHLIVSVGATYDEEIATTVQIVKNKGKKITLLHCVTCYPNSLDMCNLARMSWLKKLSEFVGWSDHTNVEGDGLKAAKVASLLGADLIERHFTILASNETKDGPISINPKHLRELKDFFTLTIEEQRQILEKEITDWGEIIGTNQLKPTYQEMLNRDYYCGRFAYKLGADWINNWDERELKKY
ncbi:N-acetylneuraminate synthase family protein [Patescibacteria group bacterium]|nr:N-acetylneuraminate synthase family protein [Patescibacteria group bacterium]